MPKKRVLFLCVGNTCRSQMAEAIVNARVGDQWEASSAGSRPGERVNPLAVKTLEEIGITHHGRPKAVDEFRAVPVDRVVILCDEDDDQCPVWLGKGVTEHRPYPDPANVTGTHAEKMAAYRSLRDRMLVEIPQLLAR
ncbi:MAG TPA: arsenate reductase ArsC [Anaerolineales bacterium]